VNDNAHLIMRSNGGALEYTILASEFDYGPAEQPMTAVGCDHRTFSRSVLQCDAATKRLGMVPMAQCRPILWLPMALPIGVSTGFVSIALANALARTGLASANGRMQPPRLSEKQPSIRTDGLLTIQYVVERRHTGPFRMSPLSRLIQLLRIAKKHQARRRLRHRQHVSERHLRRLIDKQYVHRIVRLRPCPQPRRPGRDLTPTMQSVEHLIVGFCEDNRVRRFSFLRLLDAPGLHTKFCTRPDYFVQQARRMTVWLFAVTPTRFPALTKHAIIRAPTCVLPVAGGP
jgi:hypothetical protein